MISILMTTYNGEKYIGEQLDSLINQTYTDWNLYIRDDGSTDNTSKIIDDYAARDSRISIIKDEHGNLRSCQNFNALMQYVLLATDSEYFMFCDQDDIWLPGKVEASYKKIAKFRDGSKPSFVYSSYTLIDELGNPISANVQNYNIPINLNVLLATNFIYGCTLMVNRNLLVKATPIANTAENHDYWIVLVAALANANYEFIDEEIILYRQHNSNVSGSFKDSSFLNRFKRLWNNQEFNLIRARVKMFSSLVSKSESFISTADNQLINGYINAVNKGGLGSLFYVLKNKIHKINRMSSYSFYLSLIRK